MRAVVQRVKRARVTVGRETTGEIGKGLLVLLGVSVRDTEKDAAYLADKTLNLRIFEDVEEKMNLSLLDIAGDLLVVSQFTLYGDARKGRRPSFIEAAAPIEANRLYEFLVSQFTLYGDATRGRRPSFIDAAPPVRANTLYEVYVEEARKQLGRVETGRFQAMMDVELVNDGPVTILLDSEKLF